MPSDRSSILFICLGNICRSPMAEAVFKYLIKKRGIENNWLVDSAAIIDYHVGKPPDARTLQVLHINGIKDYEHKVRQITAGDFRKFDYIFGMDHDNITDLKDLRKMADKNMTCKAKIELLGSYDPLGELIIHDPYYGCDIKDFQTVYAQCLRSCDSFIDEWLSSST